MGVGQEPVLGVLVEDQNLLWCLKLVVGPLLFGRIGDGSVQVLEVEETKVDMDFHLDQVFRIKSAGIHNC